MKDKAVNIHEDHRIRMRQKYLISPDAMPDHEILELLLFNVIPRKNTNPIAHALLNAFGSLEAVFQADINRLTNVEGVGEKTAFFIKEIQYLWKRIETSSYERETFDTLDKLARYLIPTFYNESNECIYAMLLDSRAHFIACKKVLEGTVTSSRIDARKIAEFALSQGAVRVVVAHNHLSGCAEPSDADIAATRYLRKSLSGVDLILEEHFIIAGKNYCPILDYLESNITY